MAQYYKDNLLLRKKRTETALLGDSAPFHHNIPACGTTSFLSCSASTCPRVGVPGSPTSPSVSSPAELKCNGELLGSDSPSSSAALQTTPSSSSLTAPAVSPLTGSATGEQLSHFSAFEPTQGAESEGLSLFQVLQLPTLIPKAD